MGQILAAVFNVIGSLIVAFIKVVGKVLSFIWNGIKSLFAIQQKRNVTNSVQNILSTFNNALAKNQSIKNEALSIIPVLPDVPEKQQVQNLLNYCNGVENNLQTYIDNVNKDLSSGNQIDAAFFKTKYQNALQFVSSISYTYSEQDLQGLATKYSSSNYFIDTLLGYSQVQNLNQRNGLWTYSAHGISYKMRVNESDRSVEIKAKKQRPIKFNPNPRAPQVALASSSQPLSFDDSHELVFSLKKSLDTIDHYDVFEYFDHVSHLLEKPEINPSAGKQLLTYREAEEIEDSVVDNVKGLSKIAPPPPDYVPDSQKMHGGRMRWANYFDVEKSGMLAPKGFVLGKMGYGSYLYTGNYKGHVLTIAATRTGKGVGVVIPNLLIHKGSAVILDPKGENFAVTANERVKLGNKVFYYDPWEIVPDLEKKKHGSISVNAQKACINPLDIIGQNDRDMLDKALMLASSLIVRASDKDSFFYNEAETFLARLIVFVCAKYPKDNPHRSLVEVRKLLNYDLDRLRMEVAADRKITMTKPAVDELVRWIDRNKAAKSKSTNNVIDMAQQATTFLSSHMVANSLKKSNIDIMRMKLDPTSLYLILDTNKILFNEDVYKPLVRLIVTTCFCAASIREQPREPMLFMLDEVAQLGTLQYLPKLLAIYAGMGVVVWTIWQSLAQIKSLYDKDAETITGNCSIQQYFGVNDTETAELICKMAGKTTIFEESYSKTDGTTTSSSTTEGWGNSYGHGTSSSKGTSTGSSYQGFNYTSSSGTNASTGESESYNDSYNYSRAISKGESHTSGVTLAKKAADLITPAEVMQAKSIGVQFLFYMEKCMYPILCGKIAYYEDKEFMGLFDENYTRI